MSSETELNDAIAAIDGQVIMHALSRCLESPFSS
jgi:hypothetical protein